MAEPAPAPATVRSMNQFLLGTDLEKVVDDDRRKQKIFVWIKRLFVNNV